MKFKIFLVFFFCHFLAYSQNPDLMWKSQLTGSGNTLVFESCVDQSGNIFVIGNFNGTITQDAFSLTAVGGNDGFIAKYNKNGVLLWLKQVSGPSIEQPTSIALSLDGSYVYISINSNSNPTLVDLTSVGVVGTQDIIIAKFATNGTLVWANNVAYGAGIQTNSKLAIDQLDNIVLSGVYRTDVTFFGEVLPHFTSALATNQQFIAKFDLNCSFLWAKEYLSNNNLSQIRTISIDPSGYYFGGSWNGNLTLSIGGVDQILSNAGNADMFLYKTDYSGIGQWIRKITGSGDDVLSRHRGDALGNQFLSGYYNSTSLIIDSTNLVPSTMVVSNTGNNDIYYSCYAPDGTLQFLKTFGSTGDDQGLYVTANADHVVLAGQYTGAINFGTYALTNSSTDAFMVETDRNGNVLSAKRAFGTNSDIARSCQIDNDNANIFIGDFQSATLTIEDKVLTNPLTTTRDMFIAKYGKIIISSVVTQPSCNGSADGEIDLTITGHGTAPYDFVWSGPSATTATEDQTGLLSGWYYVTLTDDNGAVKSDSVFVDQPAALAIIAVPVNTKCPTSTDGAIDITPIGGTSPFTYIWSDGAIVTEDRINLDHGTYSVTVTDANLCSTVGSATVNHPSAMFFSYTNTTESCSPGTDGTIDLSVVNGAPPYTYLWSTTGITEDISGLAVGNYLVTVTDANLCSVTGNTDITLSPNPTIAYTVLNESCAGGNGSIDVTVSDGTPGYSYAWTTSAITEDISGLVAGSYTTTVTDSKGCTATSTIAITTIPVLTASLTNHSQILLCSTSLTGDATVVPLNGLPPYTYAWSGSPSVTASASGLGVGIHYISVTDVCGTTVRDSIVISSLPDMTASITSSSPASCLLSSDGSATLTANGGVAFYTYVWGGSASITNTANNLAVGWQHVTVTDFCISVEDSVYIDHVPFVTSAMQIVASANCVGADNGTATVIASLGKTPYTYLWSNVAAETGATATQLGAGWNYVTITDACSSTKVDSILMTVQSSLLSSVTLNSEANCIASTEGSATVAVTQGVIPFTYLWDNGSTTTTATGLGIGWQHITITDGCGPKVDSVLVTSKAILQVSLSTQNILLTCATDLGSATVLTQGGALPITYTWDDMVAPGATRNDLDTGWHYVTVTDVCNNPFTGSVRVNHLPVVYSVASLVAPASCPAGGNGQAIANASSGVPPYAYVWSNSASTTASANDLLTGWQYVTISDYCGSRVDSVNVTSQPLLSTAITASTPTNCAGAFTGSATVTASNGGGSYTYVWTGGEITATAIALGEGWNYVTVTDFCSTTKLDSVNITVQSALTETVTMTTQANCPASTEGVATVNVISGAGPFFYNWTSGNTTDTETGLGIGWHYVTITDGCGDKLDSVEITNKPVLQVSLSSQTLLLTCGTDLGTVTVLTQNGVVPFTYTWDDGIVVNPTRNDLGSGWHFVTVTDFCNVPYEDSVRVNYLPSMMIDGITFEPASCAAGGDGHATITAESGVPPYTFVWSNSVSTTNTATDLLTGWQYVTVSDYCTTKIDSVEITSLPALTIDITDSSAVNCSGGTDGSATVTAINGGLPYTYLWTSGEATATATALNPGWNYVTVTDGCTAVLVDSLEILVNPVLQITSLQVSPTTCPGGTNGAATLNYTGGSAPISYIWNTLATTQSVTDLPNDTVYVTITDACGSLSTQAFVGSLPEMSISITASVDASCATSTDGKAFVTAVDGSGVYTYVWSSSSSVAANAMDLPVGWNWVTVTDACQSLVDSTNIGIKAPLDGTVVSSGLATCPTSTDGIAIATPVDGVPPYTYAWSGSAETDSIASDLAVGTVTVSITDVCTTIAITVEMTSLPAMTYATIEQNLTCFNDSTGSITVTPSLGVPPYTYAWGDTTLVDSMRTDLLAGTYNITITDVCGSTTQTFVIQQPGALSITLLPTPVQFQGETTGVIDVIVSGGIAPYYFNWSNGSLAEDQQNLAEGVFAVTVSDNNGCFIADSSEIISLSSHIIVYSGFTPNDDGKNDVWNIKYINNFPDCEVSIYNEWGIRVFQSTGYVTPWDGTKEGSPLPSGSYYYVIDLKDGSEAYTGSVTLMK